MKPNHSPWKIFAGYAAVTLAFVGALSTADAASIALNGRVFQRPLTPNEISTYGLTNAQFSAGINNVGVGEPVYLDALVNASIASSNIISVTWSLPGTNKPLGSAAALLNSPLGINVPVYNPADRLSPDNNHAGALAFQLAGRTFFRPDVVGQYTVLATITTTGVNTGTNIAPVMTNIATTVTAATYLGIAACADCHSGGLVGVPNIYPHWTNTPHASFFTKAIDGLESSHYNASCIVCHTVGYDTNSFANNGGFDDLAALLNWTFPAVLTNGNWASMPSQLQNLANIQCENCHGPGSQHLYSQGIVGNTNAIAISYGAGDCSQCHDKLFSEYQSAEWNNSVHAVTTRLPSGSASRMACVRCHTAPGFINYVANLGNTNAYATNVVYEAINCQTCHDPHDASNPHQLRTSTTVAFNGNTGFVVTNAGAGGFCMNCHNSRNGSVTNSIAKYPLAQTTWNGGSAFGPHDSPQGDMLEGINAVTYGKVIPSSPHANVVADTCVGCHYQPIATNDPAFTLAGGHTTKMSYINSQGTNVDVTYVCTPCHGKLDTFDFPVADYNGDGVIEGVQTEVQHLLDKLSTLLPNTNGVVDGLVKTPSVTTNWATKYLNAAYNWQFVDSDGSLGVHNAAYAVGLLKASIGDLIGDSNGDGLPDSWQIGYFGANYATNPQAGPNAINNTAGFPNWMMYALGLNPFSTPVVAGSGVVFFNGNNIVNGAANTIAIYTAAEIAFNTQVGTSYQIQGISALTGTWQNISTNIPGTGGSISYVTPTRNNAQMFFRVVHTP
ncbi:MAG: multiheme c-type cytochrome [Verrucomicrobiota bacterium]